jgi:hypothetical protein
LSKLAHLNSFDEKPIVLKWLFNKF